MPILLDVLDGLRFHLFVVNELHRLFIGDEFHRFADFEFARFFTSTPHILKHSLNLLGQIFHTGRSHDLHLRRHGGHFDFDFFVVKFTFAQHLAEFLPRVVIVFIANRFIAVFFVGAEAEVARGWQEKVQDSVFRLVLGAVANFFRFLLACLFNGRFD